MYETPPSAFLNSRPASRGRRRTNTALAALDQVAEHALVEVGGHGLGDHLLEHGAEALQHALGALWRRGSKRKSAMASWMLRAACLLELFQRIVGLFGLFVDGAAFRPF